MAAPEVLVLADDLTGALEVGALFAASGAQAKVGIECAPRAQVSVIDLESRHLNPEAAMHRVRDLASSARNQGVRFVFLKIDSTMRGPIAAHLTALRELWPERRIAFTPAYPRMGRTVVNGHLLVHGAPVHGTAFSQDPTHPARASHIGEILGEAFGGDGVILFDAETDEDLEAIARDAISSDPPSILAGSGGLARQAARCMPVATTSANVPPRVARPLVVCGSMHALSFEQIQHARSWPVLDCSKLSNGREALRNISTAAINRLAAEPLDAEPIDTMIVFGGDTARALMHALEVDCIEPVGEALTGVPISRIVYKGRTLTLITKAGGFGPPDLLPQLAAALHTEI